MGVSIPCIEIGGVCEDPIRGGSLDELVEVAAAHAAEMHGLSSDDARSDLVLTEIRAFIPQTSRPPEFRALSFSFINR
ncbi:MAG: DUF1059 domain-containing protein [Chloroflexi bacterium]|nr:DUF1059 domain-containing protein [Chloroflexota bacterium]MCH8102860.1 DUF1059 domain-containing protein [Chloroflexota bacterium]